MPTPAIRVYNTLTQRKDLLTPIQPNRIGIYVCGPTVYSFVHIGNARTFASFDVVVRFLRHVGYQVRYVRNYTDVDDKIIKAAQETGESAVGLAARFVAEFEKDAAALHLLPPDVSPKVSECIPEILALIERLVAKGAAYASSGDVYFSVKQHPTYAALSKRNLDDMRSGERVAPGEQKRDPLDFALWKAAKPQEPAWESPWGPGRPGWHIECSAMASKFVGDRLDLHGGGLDLIFPHHENEIAQSESASGQPYCNVWMHGGFLDLEGAKMSKSLGNVVRLRDALAQVDAEALRYFFLSTHYRAPLSFSDKSLADAEMRMEYFYETLKKVEAKMGSESSPEGPHGFDLELHRAAFLKEMCDDFNFAGALGAVSQFFAQLNEWTDKPPSKDKALVSRTLCAGRALVREMAAVLGLFEDAPEAWLLRRRDRLVKARAIDVSWVDGQLLERQQARAAKDFAKSDSIRAALKERGVEIMDSPQGTQWKVV